jgi:hypothetical protein
VITIGERATAQVERWPAPRLEVELAGAADDDGRLLGWRTAHWAAGRWTVELPRPASLGVYPLLLRESAGRPIVRSPDWLLRIFRAAAAREPTFATPEEVVRWWVRTQPHGTRAVVRRWRLPNFDKRDPRLHRLFVVGYNPAGTTGAADRLGMFVTAVREGYNGRWRLLEATVEP